MNIRLKETRKDMKRLEEEVKQGRMSRASMIREVKDIRQLKNPNYAAALEQHIKKEYETNPKIKQRLDKAARDSATTPPKILDNVIMINNISLFNQIFLTMVDWVLWGINTDIKKTKE